MSEDGLDDLTLINQNTFTDNPNVQRGDLLCQPYLAIPKLATTTF